MSSIKFNSKVEYLNRFFQIARNIAREKKDSQQFWIEIQDKSKNFDKNAINCFDNKMKKIPNLNTCINTHNEFKNSFDIKYKRWLFYSQEEMVFIFIICMKNLIFLVVNKVQQELNRKNVVEEI